MATQRDEAWIVHDGKIILEASEAFCKLFRCEHDQCSMLNQPMESIIADRDLRALAIWRGRHIMAEPTDKEFVQPYQFLRCDHTSFWGVAKSKRIQGHQYRTVIEWQYDD